MKNWTKRFALFAILGILSSAMLVGCGGGEEDEPVTNGAPAAADDE